MSTFSLTKGSEAALGMLASQAGSETLLLTQPARELRAELSIEPFTSDSGDQLLAVLFMREQRHSMTLQRNDGANVQHLADWIEAVANGTLDSAEAIPQRADPSDLAAATAAFNAAAHELNAQAEPASAQDERDAFYAGLYNKSAPMWHRLHELAVSKGYDNVQFAIECAPVYRCDCMGARKVAIDMAGNTIPCECVAAANETEPAPAQGEGDFNPDHTLFSEIRCSMPVNDDGEETRYIINEQQLQRIRALEFNRPAQTEQQPVQYTIGDLTYARVFKAAGLTNLSVIQAVLDAVEAAIAQLAPQPEQSRIADRLNSVIAELKGGFVACQRCGDQEDTATLDCVPELEAIAAGLATSPTA